MPIKAEVTQKQKLAEDMFLLKVKAPNIAPRIAPGQYVLAQIKDESKRIPLFISQTKDDKISFIVSSSDDCGEELVKMKKGDAFPHIIGPLGHAVQAKELGNICIVTEGSNIGQALLIAQAFKKFENRVYFIAGFKHKKHKYWEKQVSKVVDKTHYVIERKNQALTHPVIKEVHHLLRRKHIHLLIALVNPILLKEIAHLSRLRTKVLSSMLPLIKDSMGTCGACRLTVKDETKLCCIDGPFLEAHSLNWEEVLSRYENPLPTQGFCKKYSL